MHESVTVIKGGPKGATLTDHEQIGTVHLAELPSDQHIDYYEELWGGRGITCATGGSCSRGGVGASIPFTEHAKGFLRIVSLQISTLRVHRIAIVL